MSIPVLDSSLLRVIPPVATPFSERLARVDRAVRARLGGPVIYRPATGAPVEVSGVFDEQFALAQSDPTQAGVETLGPAVFLTLADLPVDPEQDEPTLTVGGRDYHVTGRKTDGVGGIVLVLRLVA